MDFFINDQNHARLTRIDQRMDCFNCGKNLACRKDETILIKAFVTLYDKKTGAFILRCGGCKLFSEIGKDGNIKQKVIL